MKRKAPVSKDLIIEATRTTLGVEFFYSKGLLRLSGDSFPENAADFFQPLLQWVKDYVGAAHEQTKVEFRVKYFNTSSSRYIFQIMEILHGFEGQGNPVQVVWISHGQDDDMLDTWRELMDELEMAYAVESE